MLRSILTRLLFGSTVFIISHASGQSARVRHTPLEEGWAWAKSFEYDIDGKKVDFSPAHLALSRRELNKVFEIGGPNAESKDDAKSKDTGNICVASFSFVLDKKNDPSCKLERLTEPFMTDDDIVDLLGQHVFVSGFDPKVSCTEFLPKEDTAFCSILKVSEQKGENVPESSPSQTKPIAAFIHPPYEDYASPDQVIEKTCKLYSSVEKEDLPIKAKFAKQWEIIAEKIQKKDAVTDQELFDQWFNEATQELGFETYDKLGLFFCHNEDSEQKMMYYLSFVTDKNKEIEAGRKKLLELINEMSLYCSIDPVYRSSQLIRLMRVNETDRTSGGFGGLPRELKENHQKKMKQGAGELQKGIDDRVNDLSSKLESLKLRTKSNQNRLSYLRDCLMDLALQWNGMKNDTSDSRFIKIQKMLDTLKDKNKELETELANIPEKKPEKKVDKNKDKKVDKNKDNDVSSNKESEAEPASSVEKKSEVKSGKKKDKNVANPYKKDRLVEFFRKAAEVSLTMYPGFYIKAIILHIHSTNDICFSCAPDLAQECIRKDGFAADFSSLVENLNPEKEKPLFRVVYSCRNLRNGRESSRTALLQPKISSDLSAETESSEILHQSTTQVDDDGDVDDKNVQPDLTPSRKFTVKFYQHYLKLTPEEVGASARSTVPDPERPSS